MQLEPFVVLNLCCSRGDLGYPPPTADITCPLIFLEVNMKHFIPHEVGKLLLMDFCSHEARVRNTFFFTYRLPSRRGKEHDPTLCTCIAWLRGRCARWGCRVWRRLAARRRCQTWPRSNRRAGWKGQSISWAEYFDVFFFIKKEVTWAPCLHATSNVPL